MIETIVKWALCAAIVAGIGYSIVWGYETWRDAKVAEGDKAGAARIQHQWDDDKVKRAGETVAAVAKARKEEQTAAARAAKGERDANANAAAKAASDLAAAKRATAVAGGLRDHIAALDAAARSLDMPSAAALAGQFVIQRDAAIRARGVLGSCVAEYTALGQAADERTRAIARDFETAMSYVKAVAPVTP
jgi:hypothetical protein